MSDEQVNIVTLFYCYVHEDEPLRDELDKHLAAFKRLGHLTGWHDRQIQAGTDALLTCLQSSTPLLVHPKQS